jgi:hypothetical protein
MLKRFVMFLFLGFFVTTQGIVLPVLAQSSHIEQRGKDGDDDDKDDKDDEDDDSGGGSDNSGSGSDDSDDSDNDDSDDDNSGSSNSGSDNSGSGHSGSDSSGSDSSDDNSGGNDNGSSGSDNGNSGNSGNGNSSGDNGNSGNSGNGGNGNSDDDSDDDNSDDDNSGSGNSGDDNSDNSGDDNKPDKTEDNSGNDEEDDGEDDYKEDDYKEDDYKEDDYKEDDYKEDDRHYYVGSVSANDGVSLIVSGKKLESTSPWLEILDTGMLFEAYGLWKDDATFVAEEINVLAGEDWAYVRAPGVLLGESNEQLEAWTRGEKIETARVVTKEVTQDSVRVVAFFDGTKVRGLPASLTPPLPTLPSGWAEFTGRFDGDGVVWESSRSFP